MAEPGEISFECIGCGTKNPAGAVVCSGCGHSFAGPRVEANPPTGSQDPLIVFDDFRRPERFDPSNTLQKPPQWSDRRPGLGFQFLKLMGCLALFLLVLVVAAGVFVLALFIAFVAVCNPRPDASVVGIGLGSVLVVSIGFGLIVLLNRWLRRVSDE
jgi:hypothetical protein